MHAKTLPLPLSHSPSNSGQGYQESDRSNMENIVLDSQHTHKLGSEHVKGTMQPLYYTDNPMISRDEDREMTNGNTNGHTNGHTNGSSEATKGGGGGVKNRTDNDNNRTYNNFINSTVNNNNRHLDGNNRHLDGNSIEMMRNRNFNQTAENENPSSDNSNLNSGDVKRTPLPRRRDIPYPTVTVKEQLNQIWLTVQLKAVWKPMVREDEIM